MVTPNLRSVDTNYSTPPARHTIDDGGDGPQDGDVKERIAKLEALFPTLATKADLGELRADVHKVDASIKTWMIATVLGMIGAGAAMSFGLFNAARAPVRVEATPPQPPIIITIPAPSAQPAAYDPRQDEQPSK